MDPALNQHRERFEADPGDTRAFETLEEHHYTAGRWEDLVALYRRRLTAPDLAPGPDAGGDPAARAALVFRLGQIQADRCQEYEDAVASFEETARLQPGFRPALTRLRELYADRDQWELVLQVGELEVETEMPAGERAALLAQLGTAWHERLGDAEHAQTLFDRALVDAPHHPAALAGRARALAGQGLAAEAAEAWERVVEHARGADRAQALVALADLCRGALGTPERSFELYRRAYTDDPSNAGAVEPLLAEAERREQWGLVAELYERRFDLAAGATARSAVAREAGQFQLERLRDPATARGWLERALELAPDDPSLHAAMAGIERALGESDALGRRLERIHQLTGEAMPAELRVEAAALSAAAGDDERSIEHLLAALAHDPGRADVLDALATSYERADRYAELAELLEERVAALDAGEGAARAAVQARLAVLYEGPLDRSDDALRAWKSAFAADPAHAGAGAALERLYRQREAWADLRTLLESRLENAAGSGRVPLLCALGELICEHFDARELAGKAFEEALELEPNTPRALHGLQRLALESDDEEAVLRSYEREAETTDDRGRLAFLVWELVQRLEERGDPSGAVGWLERLVGDGHDDRQALEACARLYEALDRSDDLVATLARLDGLLSGPAQAACRRRLAGVHERAGRCGDAIAAWNAALEADPRDLEALRALVPALEQSGRLRELARVLRSLCELTGPPESTGFQSDLAHLLAERLDDPDSAIVVLWRLVEDPDAPSDVDERLEGLLERTGRFEELAQRLQERRHTCESGSVEARELDLQRAKLLAERLSRFDDAVEVYRGILATTPDCDEALRGLERDLRRSGDSSGLADVLAARAVRSTSTEERDALDLERASLLEEGGRADEAGATYRALAEAGGPSAAEAETRLRRLLEREQDWSALCERLACEIDEGDAAERAERHARLASLQLERLGDAARARRHLESATALAPERADLWRRLAALLDEAAEPDTLRRALEGELDADPDAERALSLHARVARLCRDALHDEDGARRHYERLRELAPDHVDAVEFLAEIYERDGREGDLAPLLAARLERLEGAGDEERTRRASLRVRIAALYAEHHDDVGAAIGVLEPALDEVGPESSVACPLADLYERAGRDDALLALAPRVIAASDDTAERADWNLRLGGALRRMGDRQGAIAAHREALAARPGDPTAQTGLEELYREERAAEPLARLLEAQLAQRAGAEETPLRLELASLLEGSLGRPAEALLHLRRILELDPDHDEARERGLRVAESLGEPRVQLEFLDAALPRTRTPEARADLLERRGRLLAGPLGEPLEAVPCLREALALDPSRRDARRVLRGAQEALGNWDAVLEGLHAEARSCAGEERAALFDQGARLAAEHISPDASLPWLDRLRSERPDDGDVATRIADLHRAAGRPEALMRALEDALPRIADAARRRDLLLERAGILEQLGAPGRAIAALCEARRDFPDDTAILATLDRLYADAGRDHERSEILAARIDTADPSDTAERDGLRRELARLQLDSLGQPERAADTLAACLEGDEIEGHAGIALRQLLGRALHEAGRPLAWARNAVRELALLDADEPVFAERRFELHRELARVHAEELADPGTALVHLRAIVDADCPIPPEIGADFVASAEDDLCDLLRAEGSHMELASRLARRLARRDDGDDADGWLELARLREERLHEPAGATAAYRALLERAPHDRTALRGLRRTAERSGDWAEVARSFELELDGHPDLPAAERAALWRALGHVCWHRLQSTTRASRAYTSALEADPTDLDTLVALGSLHATMENWSGALELAEREVERLGEDDPARRRDVHLRIARLARDRQGDLRRAIVALEAADALDPLAPDERFDLAELHRRAGDRDAYIEVFGRWCDDDEAAAGAADHLTLARALAAAGRPDDALARAERAAERDPAHGEAWLEIARLREERGDASSAADAWVQAADHSDDAAAAHHLEHAAALCEDDDAARSADLLETALARDAASASAHVALARVASGLGRAAAAEDAAARALDLAAGDGSLSEAQRLEAALLGAHAARAQRHLEAAARFATTARALAPDSPEALALDGEVLFALGETDGARRALEARLALPGHNAERSRQLALLAACRESAGDHAAALDGYREVLAQPADGTAPTDAEAARAGIVRLCERLGRLDQAVAALVEWAGSSDDERARADHLTRAAELELTRGSEEALAESHLRAALAADPTHAQASLLLTTRLAEAGREDEALALSARALEGELPGDACARLALLRGRLLEARGQGREAASAYARAADADPTSVSGALAQARILRGLGEWSQAAEVLATCAERHGNDDDEARPGLAAVHFQRGRLLAGPLEDVDAALDAYRQAVRVHPQAREAQEALSGLLVHRPDLWDEALARHRELLDEDPTRLGSLRAVQRIAVGRGHERAAAAGRALLKALGVATAEERATAPARFDLRVASQGALTNPIWERVRGMAREVAPEIARALSASPRPEPAVDTRDAAAAFHAAALAAEGDLCAAALVPLDDDALGDTLRIVASLALDAERVHGDGHRVNALSAALGRRARRRARKLLGSIELSEILELDFDAWRAELRTLAHGAALDAGDGDLRPALVALVRAGPDGESRAPGPGDDLSELVKASPEAGALLRRAVAAWLDAIVEAS